MKRLLLLLVLFAALVCEALGADQSAGKTIDRYKKASGGKLAARLKSTLMTGSVKTLDGCYRPIQLSDLGAKQS